MTYKEAFDKITIAYIKDELNPWVNCACFVGNLLNNTDTWSNGRYSDFNKRIIAIRSIQKQSKGFYLLEEILSLERIFLHTLNDNLLKPNDIFDPFNSTNQNKRKLPEYENALFKAMETTLEYLKQIHIKKGELIEETPILEKRILN